MNVELLFLTHTLLAGIVGAGVRVYIAAFLLFTESLCSQSLIKRYFFRYATFSFHFLVSFLVTPALGKPLLDPLLPRLKDMSQVDNTIAYYSLCLPLAALLYCVDYRTFRRADVRKVEARQALRRRMMSE